MPTLLGRMRSHTVAFVRACIFACMYVYTCVRMHVCMYACMHACMYACIYMHISQDLTTAVTGEFAAWPDSARGLRRSRRRCLPAGGLVRSLTVLALEHTPRVALLAEQPRREDANEQHTYARRHRQQHNAHVNR